MITQKKRTILMTFNTLHPAPEKIQDDLFLQSPFFDPYDALQVKYEMLRHVHVDEWSIKEVASLFCVSRPTFYKIEADFNQFGLVGLLPKKTGPRDAYKLTPEAVRLIKTLRLSQAKSWNEVAQVIEQKLGYPLHTRTMQKALQRQEKKRRN